MLRRSISRGRLNYFRVLVASKSPIGVHRTHGVSLIKHVIHSRNPLARKRRMLHALRNKGSPVHFAGNSDIMERVERIHPKLVDGVASTLWEGALKTQEFMDLMAVVHWCGGVPSGVLEEMFAATFGPEVVAAYQWGVRHGRIKRLQTPSL